MSLFPQFPFTNFHELNLDWILKKIKGYDDKIDATNARQDEIEEMLDNVEDTVREVATEVIDDAISSGAFDDDLAALVQPIQTEVTTAITEQNTSITNQFSEIESGISSQFTTQNGRITDVENTVASFDGAVVKNPQNTNLMIITDSYGTGVGSTTTWCQRIITQGIFNSVTIIANGGCGFTGKYSNGNPFPAQEANDSLKFQTKLQNWVSNHTATERNAIDVILVAGGFNDVYSDFASIRDAIAAFMTYAKPLFPKAVFYLAEIGWCGFGTGSISNPGQRSGVLDLPSTSPIHYVLTSLIRQRIAQFVIPAYSGAGVYGMYYLGTAIGALHNYYLDFVNDDGYHPSDTGHVNLSKWIVNKLCGNANFVDQYSSLDLYYNPNFSSALPTPPQGQVTLAAVKCTETGVFINHSLEYYFEYTPAADTGSNTSFFNNFMNIIGLRTNILPSPDVSMLCFIRGIFDGDTGYRSHLGIVRIYQGTYGGTQWTTGQINNINGEIGIAIFPMEGAMMVAGNKYNVRFLNQFIPYEMC